MRDAAIRWHLQHNFFPPYPEAFVPIALDALALANKGGGTEEALAQDIPLPENLRGLGTPRSVGEVLEDLHLLDAVAV